MKNLKKNVQKKIEASYLIQGEDNILYDKALEIIKKACNLTLEEFNFITFDDDTFNGGQVLASLQTLPIGGDKKIVLLKNITKISEDFKKKLNIYLKNPVLSSCLVVFDFFNKFDFMLSEKVSAKRLDERTLFTMVQSRLEDCGKTITTRAGNLLISYCNGYYTLIANELEKLCVCDVDVVDIAQIEDLVTKEEEFTVFELTEALSKRDANKAVTLLNLMPKDTKTFTLILNHFRRMFFVSISKEDDVTLSKMFNVKEYAITKSRILAKNFSKIQLKNIYELLDNVDFYIKNGQMQVENALYYLIFGIIYC